MIEVQNVSKTYPTGIRANHSISFTVKQGEIVALVGPNGSGKTTLMQQMLGVLKIGEGSIRIDGAENNTQNIAYIPQTPAIYPALTVRESLLATTKYLGVPQKKRRSASTVFWKNRAVTQCPAARLYLIGRSAKALILWLYAGTGGEEPRHG